MTGEPSSQIETGTPTIARRLICLLYEGVVLFGVVMMIGFAYSTLTSQRHALIGTAGLQITLLFTVGLYFVWFWSHGGQTVAMKTWRIRVLTADGSRLSTARACARYLLGWLWLLPALAIVHLAGLKDLGSIVATVIAGMLTYAALSRLHPGRQFLHDAVCGTRLVNWPHRPQTRS